MASKGQPLAILFLTDCAECATKDWVREWNNVARVHSRFKMVIATERAVDNVHEIRRFEATHRNLAPLVVAQEASLSSFCNAYFRPRIALFDDKGKLIYLQSPERTGEQSLKEIQKLMRAFPATVLNWRKD
jgi:hypothetical protein